VKYNEVIYDTLLVA